MILLDTSILARFPDSASLDRPVARTALATLLRRNEQLVIVPQNLYEFWAVATRRPGTLASGGQNGLGLSADRAILWIRRYQGICRTLPEIPEVLSIWKDLLATQKVTGFKAHDLRLVAAMKAHRIPRVLTFNVQHFQGFGVEVADPKTLT